MTQLSDFTFTFHFHALEKEMATHSSVLAWRIPGGFSRGACWAAVYVVAQSRTRLKRPSSSSSLTSKLKSPQFCYQIYSEKKKKKKRFHAEEQRNEIQMVSKGQWTRAS